uniref:Uncharacterized protein n=1 Tax=Ciona intestinalis TaxID=7719 RepID=H2XLL2_CIOIN
MYVFLCSAVIFGPKMATSLPFDCSLLVFYGIAVPVR